jgi:hypothetical protein
MKRQFLLAATMAAALMLGGCDAIFGGDQVTGGSGVAVAQNDDAPLQNAKPDIEATVSKIFSDHDKNQLAAEKLYSNKIVKVTGFFFSVDEDTIDVGQDEPDYTVVLRAPESADRIYAILKNHSPRN